MKNYQKNVTLELKYFLVRGTATIYDWYDNKGVVEMKEYRIPVDEVPTQEVNGITTFCEHDLLQKVRAGVNDGKFGAKQILYADVTIYGVYRDPYLGDLSSEYVTEFDSYQLHDLTNCKLGV